MVSGRIPYLFLTLFLPFLVAAQNDSTKKAGYVTVAASDKYKKSKLHQFFLGRNRRKEWAVPVRVQVVSLDTLLGGLVPYEKSGGGESKSLRLRSRSGREYAMRSIDKSRISALSPFLKKSFYGRLVQDGVSMSHPYGAFAIPVMAQQAGIYHTRPMLMYIPEQNALDTFNALYANDLYLLEERAEGNWSGAPHLGGYQKYLETEEVEHRFKKSNRYMADQKLFIKARLFDMLISDVDRHGGNWRWGVHASDSTLFYPVPGDRDQAFFTHNGLLTSVTIALTRRRLLQNFTHRIKNVKSLTSHDMSLDRFFANQMTGQDWQAAANEIKASLSDSVIFKSVAQLPAEVFAVSGNEIISKLQSRRDRLEQYGARYHKILAKRVSITGSKGREHFEIRRGSNNSTLVQVYRIGDKGQKEAMPYYERTFTRETKRITLYSHGGKDVFEIEKHLKGLKIKVKKSGD